MMAPDISHESELGTIVSMIQHLLRILHDLPDGPDRILELNSRLARSHITRNTVAQAWY